MSLLGVFWRNLNKWKWMTISHVCCIILTPSLADIPDPYYHGLIFVHLFFLKQLFVVCENPYSNCSQNIPGTKSETRGEEKEDRSKKRIEAMQCTRLIEYPPPVDSDDESETETDDDNCVIVKLPDIWDSSDDEYHEASQEFMNRNRKQLN
uniref:Secreted protein n=2 Tax=Caenorhabditis tropicalis TaxID=1561998 RepID=A0A1I7SYK8_9PELO